MTGPGIDKQVVFDGLVENALYFLERAIKDFKGGDLQQSQINFVTGVELCLKARLLLEHWTLILTDPKKADPVRFMAGKFQSVGIKEAIERLEKIVGLHISPAAKTTFDDIWSHRKQMVHFYHPEYITESDDKAKSEIAGLELHGWGHIYVLITKSWHAEFVIYRDRFDAIEAAMGSHKEFLKGKYEALQPHINEGIKSGAIYRNCTTCGNIAVKLEENKYPRFYGFCQVCPSWIMYIEAKCGHCETDNYLEWDWEDTVCGNASCNQPFGMDDLLGIYGSDTPEDGETANGYCPECYYAHDGRTVVELDSGAGYLCLSCFEIYVDMDQCGFCGERVAGIDEVDSGYTGCMLCSDAAEEHFDRD